jgi:hypothetical protein
MAPRLLARVRDTGRWRPLFWRIDQTIPRGATGIPSASIDEFTQFGGQ